MLKISKDRLHERIDYGLYCSKVQYYINGVDGTLAQLGSELPPAHLLDKMIKDADVAHAKLILQHDREIKKQEI